MDAKKSRIRHIAKSITWRIVASITTFVLAYLFFGDLAKASGLMAVEVVIKMLLYYLHERAWYNYIRLGRDNE
ncbi:MAG TPA: DUF2061 domain-containing protein [Flavobacteriales bacterium]|nr:DUF2061 domain-containing protein [Flavobacteriales bacterium]HHZ95289.1 DUF2061 domain-containing protein [Flavobacteriales bacterium]HIB78313.1 DUF2061 domain-containing protein [Flavobacteriales bacterium]HIN40939.1 DUF2061 domain-containing protein [Flavobacteriales bacterium]HIO15692.1 DUF2061 domain-containing protein [Flavobacteriales bacterium]